MIFIIASDSVHKDKLHFITRILPKYLESGTTVMDTAEFDALFEKVSADMERDYGLKSERDTSYKPIGRKCIATKVGGGVDCNAFTLRFDWMVAAFDDRNTPIAYTLANDLREVLTPDAEPIDPATFKVRGYGYDIAE